MRVALLGCGNVGAAVVRLLHDQREHLTARVGEPLELAGVAVRRLDRDRSHLPMPAELFTDDAAALATRPDIDIVVELVGGVEPARGWILAAMAAGKSVVTGNKVLLAEAGAELYAAADAAGVDLYYEASVAAAIPLLRPLRESLHGDRITKVTGIVNGTTNFILSRMTDTGGGYAEALAEAGALGYAEADPTADVEGYDAAAKAAIVAGLAFHTTVTASDVHREGITEVTAADIAGAAQMDCVIKLLCIAARDDDEVSVRVHPAMIPNHHPLASVGGAYNAVFIEAEAAGRLMFYGAGAGGDPSASAVLGDLVVVARNRRSGQRAGSGVTVGELPIRPMGRVPTRYHVSLDVDDEPGVLAEVASVFARRGVSMATVRQSGRDDEAGLVAVTHVATDAQLSATVTDLSELAVVRRVAGVMRVEGES